jgi:hypothetical protein
MGLPSYIENSYPIREIKATPVLREGLQMSAINPQHYKQGNIEVIDFILDQKMSYLIASATKYLCRFPHKHSAGEGRLDDLRKARWFIEKQIEEILKEEELK